MYGYMYMMKDVPGCGLHGYMYMMKGVTGCGLHGYRVLPIQIVCLFVLLFQIVEQ